LTKQSTPTAPSQQNSIEEKGKLLIIIILLLGRFQIDMKKSSLIPWFSYLEKIVAILLGIVLFLIILRGSNDLFGISKLTDKIYFTNELHFKSSTLKPAYDSGEIDDYDGQEILKNYREEHWFRHGICMVIILLQGIISISLAVFTTQQLFKKYRQLRFRERLTSK
jgi:hypothetical protein